MNKLFGKTVRFKAIASRSNFTYPTCKKVKSWKLRKSILGVIIGGRYFRDGELKYDNNYEYFGGCKFIPKKSVFVYEVKYGFLNKSVFVLPEDIRVIEEFFEMPMKTLIPR